MLTTLSFMSCRKAENLTTNSDDVPPGLLCFIWLLSRKIYLVSSQTTPVVSKRWIDSLLWAVVKATNMTSFNGTNALENQINIPRLTVTRQRGLLWKIPFMKCLTSVCLPSPIGRSESGLIFQRVHFLLSLYCCNSSRSYTTLPEIQLLPLQWDEFDQLVFENRS